MTKRLALLLLLLLLPMLPVTGRRLPRYPFVKTRENTLQLPAGPSAELSFFFRKLDTLLAGGRTDVRILHVGGSHVQGGTFPDRLRTRFLSLRYGMDGGRGLVFPFSAASTNTPVSYNSSYRGAWDSSSCLKGADVELGLTGMVATAQDTSARVFIDLAPREGRVLHHRYTFNRVDVMGGGSLVPYLLLEGKDTVRGVVGPELVHFDLPYYTDWLQLAFEGKGIYQLRGLYLDKASGGFSLSEAGVNGASTRSWLQCDKWEEDLRRVMPDLIIFSIGINDIQGSEFDVVRFKAHYRELIRRARGVNPRCAILFSGINDSWRRHYGVNDHTAQAQAAFQDLAREYKAAFWDWYRVMGGQGSMAQWQEAGLAQADKIHFTPDGYRLVGDLLFDAIMDEYHRR